jgi:RNA polymerase sigma-70 factor (ECF subfamily)
MSPAESSVELTQTYQSLRQPLLAYLRRLVGDTQSAEDVLQDVLVKAIASRRSDAAPPRNLPAWLYRVAHNAAMDHHRARRPSEPLDDELAEVLPAPEADPALAAAALADCMRPLLSNLPESYRAVVHASELEGRSLREIADAHGISLDAAKQRASRGRRQLRDELLRCCEVALSAQGQVVDFSPRGARCSAPCGSSCSR